MRGDDQLSGPWCRHGWSLPVLALLVLLGRPSATHAQQAAGCRFPPIGLIADRVRELDGEHGPLGCALGPEHPIGTGRARAQPFVHGEVVWSPEQGERLVVAAYQHEDNIIVNWGDTRPNTYRKFLVRWRRGNLAGQADVTEYVSGNRGFFTIHRPVPGDYEVIVKGCNGDCAPDWTQPTHVTYVPLAPPPFPQCPSNFQPKGLIGAKWADKGGAEGPMGCPIGPEQPVPGRRGAIQSFSNGEIAFSPDQGDGLTVLLFRTGPKSLNFEWDDTSPHGYDEILLRLEKDGREVTQRSLPGDASHGWGWDDAPNDGVYVVKIEGRKDRETDTGWTIPVSVHMAGGGMSTSRQPPRCDVQGDENIRRHWGNRLRGPDGVLGCPRGPARPFPGRNGRIVDFERGQIVASPDLGADLTIAAWQEGYRINVDWGAAKTFQHDKVLVRATYEGADIGQDEIKDAPEVTGYTLKDEPEKGDNDEHLVTRRGAGDYSVIIKGCDHNCQPSWSIPVAVEFHFPNELPPDASFTTPHTVEEALRGKAARARLVRFAVANQPRDLAGTEGHNVGDDETIQMIAMLELVAEERRAGHDGRALRRPAHGLNYVGEINNAFRTATIYAMTGTSCDTAVLATRTGEYDTALKGYIPILYRYASLLAPDVRFRLHYLLSKTGSHEKADEEAGRCHTRETENHQWMIESSRYLANQLWARFAGGDKYNNATNGLRNYIFKRLTGHLDHDFEEYNARPYTRYTWAAIQNLYDYAEDPLIKDAAQSVLDYWATKVSLYTDDGRASPPFRRRSGQSGHDAYAAEGDRVKKALMLYTAPTLSMGELLMPNGIESQAPPLMALASATTYQPPDLVLDLLVNHEHRSFYQMLAHATTEIYASERDFLISAGGLPAKSAITFAGIAADTDRGVAQRTAIIPTGTLSAAEQFIRFEYEPAIDDPNRFIGLCVAPGFACGLNPVVPPRYLQPGCAIINGPWTFVDFSSPGCRRNRAPDYGYYAAVFGVGTPWGFFEAVPRARLAGIPLAEFATRTLAHNRGTRFEREAENRYVDFAGATIRFDPRAGFPILATGRPALDDALRKSGSKALAFGTIINGNSREAPRRSLTITNAGRQEELVIEWTDTSLTRTLRSMRTPPPSLDPAPARPTPPAPAPTPAPTPPPTPHPTTTNFTALRDGNARLAALLAVGVDESADDPAALRDWMMNAQYTPYPAIGQALVDLLGTRHLRRKVSIDVIVANYGPETGPSSPRRASDVDLARLRRAILEGHNNRYAEHVARFEDLLTPDRD